MLDHPVGSARVVRAVAVHEHVDLGLDVGKHAPDDVALALQRLRSHEAPAIAAMRAVSSLELLS